MREVVSKLSDRLLSTLAPRAVAQAKYCITCTDGKTCNQVWVHEKWCLNAQQGWIFIGCYDHCP